MAGRTLFAFLAGFSVAIGAGLASAEPQAGPFHLKIEKPLVITMKGSYEKNQAEATYTILPEEKNGRPAIHAVWETTVLRTEFWLEQGSGLPIEVRYDKGKKGEKVEIRYDRQGTEADFTLTQGQEVKKSHVKADETFYDALTLDVLLMGFPFDAPKRIDFTIIDADSKSGDTYGAYVEQVGKKSLKAGGRDVECVDILFALTGLAGHVAPKYHFYYEAAAPHRYVSYTGPDEEFTVTGIAPPDGP